MASCSISAVRTSARKAGVGAEKECDSCFRSPLSGAPPVRLLPVSSEASPGLGCSPPVPELFGFSWLLMARYPDSLSALYSNSQTFHTITQEGHTRPHFRERAATHHAESTTSESHLPNSLAIPRCYLSPGVAGNTEWRGSGMATPPLAACHKMAFSSSVSAASATEKSSTADSLACGASFALA